MVALALYKVRYGTAKFDTDDGTGTQDASARLRKAMLSYETKIKN